MSEIDRARQDLIDYSGRLVTDGLCMGTSGNISVRIGDQVFITPSSIPAADMTPELIAETDLDGRVVAASSRPSTELPFHTAIYNGTDAGAVVHTHSMYATALSTTIDELPAIHYMINHVGGPVRVVPYCTFGTEELAQRVRAGVKDRYATLIQNHGTVAYGATLAEAYFRAQLLEWLSELYWRALQVGTPRILSESELAEVREQNKRLRYAWSQR